jgi:hypothetical protein
MQAIDYISARVIAHNLVPYLVSSCVSLTLYILFGKRSATKRIRKGLNLGVDICDVLDGRSSKRTSKPRGKPRRKRTG